MVWRLWWMVAQVMAVKHWLNGHEIAIDRATPKEEPSVLKSMLARLPLAANQRRSFDNGQSGWRPQPRGEPGAGAQRSAPQRSVALPWGQGGKRAQAQPSRGV